MPREVAVREERTSDCMPANPFALVNPIVPLNLAGAKGARQQALATNVDIAGGGPSHGDSAAVEAPRPAMDTGAEPADADPPPATGDDAHTRGGVGYVAGEATDERLGQYPRAEASAAETRTPASGQDHGVGSQTPKSAPEAAGEPSGKQTTPRNLSLLKMQNEEHQEKTCEDITPH